MLAEPMETVAAKIKMLKSKGLDGYPHLQMSIGSVEDDEEKGCSIYTITMKTDLNFWESKKTYREFKSLCDDLKRKHHYQNLPQLPGKPLFASKTQVSTQRKALLEDLLKYIQDSDVVKLVLVQNFLDFPQTLRVSLKDIWDVLDSPILEGELEKLGANVKNWKRRHVQCCVDYTMRYYDPARWMHGSEEKLAMQKGMVDLRDIIRLRQQRDDVQKPFILEIVTKNRIWRFSYKDQKELDTWFSTVQMLREDKAGLRDWIPAASSLVQDQVPEFSEDEDTKEDLIAIEKAQNERNETEREIECIREKISGQTAVQKRRTENMVKFKQELENQHRLLKLTMEKIEKIQNTKKRLRAEGDEKEQALKKLSNRLMEQYQEMQRENNAFQSTLTKHGLVAVDKQVVEQDLVYTGFRDLDPSPIVEGRLWKFGKGGKKKPKKKYVVFVALAHGCYVEWTDSVKANQATTRIKLLGWSLDNNLMDSRKLKDEELNRLFILRGTDRIAIFLAESLAERNRWIDGFQRAKLVQLEGIQKAMR